MHRQYRHRKPQVKSQAVAAETEYVIRLHGRDLGRPRWGRTRQLSTGVDRSPDRFAGLGEQPLPLISHQFLMADDPRRMGATPTSALLGLDPPQPAPLADGELGSAHQPGEFLRRVVVLDR